MRKVAIPAVLLVVACLVALNVTSCSIASSLKSLRHEQEARRADDWRELIVHDIIVRQAGALNAKGVTEAEIKKEYAGEAAKWTAGPPKEEPTDEELRRALHSLFKSGQIAQTPSGAYAKYPTLGLPDLPFPPLPNKQ